MAGVLNVVNHTSRVSRSDLHLLRWAVNIGSHLVTQTRRSLSSRFERLNAALPYAMTNRLHSASQVREAHKMSSDCCAKKMRTRWVISKSVTEQSDLDPR